MTKTYTKEEIKGLLKDLYNAEFVLQLTSDYDDDYRIFKKTQGKDTYSVTCVETVSFTTAVLNEAEAGTYEVQIDLLKRAVIALTKNEEVLQIGNYEKLAEDLYVREY